MSIEVDGLILHLENGVALHKYDDWPVYRDGIQKLRETKGLDIVGIHENQVFLGEVKNFRGHRVENKKKLQHGTLYVQTAQKLRDTLAGLVAISRGGSQSAAISRSIVDGMLSRKRHRVVVFLYVDEDDSSSRTEFQRRRRQQNLDVHLKKLKNQTSWFPASKVVLDRNNIPVGLPITRVVDL